MFATVVAVLLRMWKIHERSCLDPRCVRTRPLPVTMLSYASTSVASLMHLTLLVSMFGIWRSGSKRVSRFIVCRQPSFVGWSTTSAIGQCKSITLQPVLTRTLFVFTYCYQNSLYSDAYRVFYRSTRMSNTSRRLPDDIQPTSPIVLDDRLFPKFQRQTVIVAYHTLLP